MRNVLPSNTWIEAALHFIRVLLEGSLRFKGEKVPSLTALLDANRSSWLASKVRDRPLPKYVRDDIGLHDADFPRSRKTAPHFMCRKHSNSTSSASAENEEFRHIPDCRIVSNLRSSRHQSQPRWSAVDPDKERMPVGFAPIQRKRLITEFAVRPDSQGVKLAEIMCIQFKQVSQDRGVFAQGGVKLNASGRFICVFSHSGFCRDRPHAGSRSSVEVGFVAYCSLAYSDLA